MSRLVPLLAVLAAAVARGEEPAPSGDPAPGAGPAASETAPADPAPALPALETRITGYLDSRTTVQRPRWEGLLPTANVPSLANVTELNLQPKFTWGDRASAYADLSLFEQAGGNYFEADADGNARRVGAHDNPNLRPLSVISELYGTYAFGEALNLTLGKKRVVWGPGFAVNPTDLLNPPKDPTDPAFQRAGSWLARLESPHESYTLSLVAAAKATRQYAGIPSRLVYHPDYPTYESLTWGVADERDTQPHFAAAARGYALVKETDLNFFWYFTNLYNDAFEHKNRVGASASRVFGAWEVHAEVLGQLGNPRLFVDAACVETAQAFGRCVRTKAKEIATRRRLDDGEPVVKALLGARYFFEDSALLSLEYFFNGEGYTPDEFQDYVRALARGRALAAANPAMAPAVSRLMGQGSGDPGSPQKFTFESQQRHYAFVSWMQPQIRDDFTFSATLLLNLQDLSGQLAPSLAWSVREWVTVTAGLFAPIPGLAERGVEVDGERYTEYGLLPSDWRGYASARVFY